MSTPGPLANQARSVYRLLIRASNSTFAGESALALALACSSPPIIYDCDIASQHQFRSVIRTTFLSPTLTSPIKPSNTAPPPTSCSPPASSSSATTSSSGATVIPPPTPTPAAEPTSLTEPEYLEKLQHWREVAKILRENIVQGERIEKERAQLKRQQEAEKAARIQAEEAEEEDAPIYRLRLTPHTELGDNDSIKLKTPQKVESTPFPNRSNEAREKRRKERERRIRERQGQ